MLKIIKVTELRQKTAELIERVSRDKEPVIIVVRSSPKVVIEPVENYQEREKLIKELRRRNFELETLASLEEARRGLESGPFTTGNQIIERAEKQADGSNLHDPAL